MSLSSCRLRAVTSIVAGIVVAAAVFFIWRQRTSVPTHRPLEELQDGVFHIEPDRYEMMVTQLSQPSAVFLPAPVLIQPAPVPGTPSPFLGPDACADCHDDYVETSRETAHFRTMRLPSEASIRGPLGSGNNLVRTRSAELSFVIEQRDHEVLQCAEIERGGQVYRHAAPIELVAGSGKIGQSFLYWQEECLYELPLSYFSQIERWVNSPGYIDGTANFARPIGPRCLECHTTWIQQLPGRSNHFSATGAVLGVTCEKCHGSGRDHVAYHNATDAETGSDPIVNTAALSRDRQLELCSLCHSGVGEFIKPPFSYRPGEPLADYLTVSDSADAGPGGVHSANQRARLSLSRCFQESSEMTCTTCHNPHVHERGEVALFAERCLNCHEVAECGQLDETPHLQERCTDCHMPRREDTEMMMESPDETFMPLLRDHFVVVDREATREVLEE